MPGPGLDNRPGNGTNPPNAPATPAPTGANPDIDTSGWSNEDWANLLNEVNSAQPDPNPNLDPYANIDNWDEAAYANLFTGNAEFEQSIKDAMTAEAMQPVAPPSLFGDMTKQEVALLAYDNAENPYTGEIFDRHKDTVSMDYFNQGTLDNYSGDAFENTDDIFKYTDSLDLNVDRRTFQGGQGGGEWQDYHSNSAVKNAAHEFVNKQYVAMGKPPIYMDGNDVYVLNTGYGGNNPVLDPTIEGNNSDGSLGPKFTGHGGYYEPEGPEAGRGEYQKFIPQNKQGPDTDMLSDQIIPIIKQIAIATILAGATAPLAAALTTTSTGATVATGALTGFGTTAVNQVVAGDFDLGNLATGTLLGAAGAYASTFGSAGNAFTDALGSKFGISPEMSGHIANVGAKTVLNGGDPIAAIKGELIGAGLDWGMETIGEVWGDIKGSFGADNLDIDGNVIDADWGSPVGNPNEFQLASTGDLEEVLVTADYIPSVTGTVDIGNIVSTGLDTNNNNENPYEGLDESWKDKDAVVDGETVVTADKLYREDLTAADRASMTMEEIMALGTATKRRRLILGAGLCMKLRTELLITQVVR